jgi:signal transduction histidine kinase/ActR/RegA family two-component response regulator
MQRVNQGAWISALEKYAAVAQLTVRLYDPDGASFGSPTFPTPLFELAARYGNTDEFDRCAKECLSRANFAPEILLDEANGFAVAGIRFKVDHEVVGAAVVGYALTRFPDQLSIQRFALRHGIPKEMLWEVGRSISPMRSQELIRWGELLQILGDGLLREQERTSETERLRQAAEAANRAKDEFISTLSHELRTPLNAIVGWVRVVQLQKDEPATVGHALEAIDRNAKAQAHIIEDLLDISRIVTGKMRLDLTLIDLPSFVDECVEAIRPAAQAKRIALARENNSSLERFLGDRGRLQQVMWNLLSNAIKFTPPEGKIQISIHRNSGSKIAVSVSDTGEGIRAEFLPHVFERFTQSDQSSTRTHSGLGLGLAVARHLVEMHGGTLSAESPGPRKGATFTFKLPLESSSEVASKPGPISSLDNDSPLTSASSPETTPDIMDGRVLEGSVVMIVEDDEDGRETLGTMLEYCGAQVTAVGTAADALSTLRRINPDVMVTDIGLPDEDGFSLLKKVRELAPEHGGLTPAIALTGYAQKKYRTQAESVGFQSCMTKPFQIQELVSAIASLIKRPAPSKDATPQT